MFDLSGKRALITGASGGIGGAIAKSLHARGAEVVLSGTRKEILDTVALGLKDRVNVIPADLSKQDEPNRLIGETEKSIGSIDILVNNAGLTNDKLSMRMKDEDWQQVINVNLTASFRLIRASLRGMMKARWGRIISITSVVGSTGNPGQANYAASKAGICGMSKSLAQEVSARGITVNCIAPGFISTAMTDSLSDDQKDRLLGNIPTGRFGSPQDVASAVVFLSSEESSYITGQTVHVNGGMAMF